MEHINNGSWRYVGTRNIHYANGRSERLHAVAVPHVNGPWEAVTCKTEGLANLVAAAPCLLESLTDLIDYMTKTDGIPKDVAAILADDERLVEKVSAAQVAIAKARGEQ